MSRLRSRVTMFDFLVFFIALRSVPSPKTSLPSNVTLPILTLSPSSISDHHAQLVVGDPLELDGGVGESIALLGVERLDLRLEAGELALRELAALEQLEPLLVDHLGDVGALELVEALVVDRDQGRALLDRHLDRDAVLERLDVDLRRRR